MAKFQPKTNRLIDAHQIIRPGNENFDPPIPEWLVTAISTGMVRRDSESGNTFTVQTLHGPVTAEVHDWLVLEPDNQHVYPVKPDIFAVRYTRAE